MAAMLPCLLASGTFGGEPPRQISFATADGGTVFADVYGEGGRDGVVLAHGSAFNRESWRPLAEQLAGKGYRVLAIDFRGWGKSTAGSTKDALFEDVLAAVRTLRRGGAARVSVIGGSMGGGAAAEATARALYEKAPEPKRLVLLPGTAHAQHIFRTDQAGRLTATIIEFLSSPATPVR